MKKLTLLGFLVLSTTTAALAQVTFTDVPKYTPTYSYDSLKNIQIPEIPALIGQEVIILDSFYVHKDTVTRAPLANKIKQTLTVVGVSGLENFPYLTWLHFASQTDTVYYSLNSSSYEEPTFITLGYYEKLAQLYKNKQLTPDSDLPATNITTGEEVILAQDSVYICKNLSIVNINNSLIPCFIMIAGKGVEASVAIHGYEYNWAVNIKRFKEVK